MRVVMADTGPLYAAVDPHDAQHKRALQELQNLHKDRRQVVTLYSTLLEAHSLILFRLGRAVAAQWLREMADATMINPTAEDYRQAEGRIQTLADQPITFFDAVVATVATRLKVEVWTYDHHFDVMRVPVWR
jgi:predicted nucleic acid-binding protein